jgi:hypothetical protein
MMRPLAAVLLCSLLLATRQPAEAAEVSPEQVRQSIAKAVKFLEQRQRLDGSWAEYPGQPGGVTALCTLALLNAGVSRDDEHVQRALKRLEIYTVPRNTYAVALQTMVFCAVDPVRYRPQVKRNAEWLESTQIKVGPTAGAWSYPGAGGTLGGDNSNSQFALLALHEAELIGVEVKRETWTKAKLYWEDCQNTNGSWGYHKAYEGTGSMTCAGLAALIITGDRFRQPNAKVEKGQILCCQPDDGTDDRIQRGLRWLGRKDVFSISGNPGSDTWLFYYLYGLERVGRLTAQRFIGGHDWYREGAEFLLANRQDSLSGYFLGIGVTEDDPVIATSLALLFLSKGRRPVLMAKLQNSLLNDWNQHRGDIDNLTRYVESRWKREMTWQTIDLQKASVEDLLQAPVLFLYGSMNPLPAGAAQQQQLAQKIRDYLDRGGFLFAEGEGCGNRSGFDEGFRKLMSQVFDGQREYALKPLGPDHPIWRAEEMVPANQLRPLEGIEFGCRTSVIYAKPDPASKPRPSLSCLWELSRGLARDKYSPDIQAQIDAARSIGINVLAYATNRELRGKEEGFNLTASPQPREKLQRGWLYIARLKHPGGCDAAPRALITLADIAGRELKIRVKAREDLLDVTGEALFDYHLVFMQGRNRFQLTDAERIQLKTYLDRGGMLMADAICTSAEFAASFRREMEAIFPDRKPQSIPADDPLWTTQYGGYDLKTVTRRDPAPAGQGERMELVRRKVPPELEGIKIDDRWAVVFSPYDISCALEKTESLDCRGYAREDAVRIAINVLMYSLQQ